MEERQRKGLLEGIVGKQCIMFYKIYIYIFATGAFRISGYWLLSLVTCFYSSLAPIMFLLTQFSHFCVLLMTVSDKAVV